MSSYVYVSGQFLSLLSIQAYVITFLPLFMTSNSFDNNNTVAMGVNIPRQYEYTLKLNIH